MIFIAPRCQQNVCLQQEKKAVGNKQKLEQKLFGIK